MANRFLSSIVALGSLLALSAPLTGCGHAKVHVETAQAPDPPPPAPAPVPEPVKEQPKEIVDNKIVLPGELEFEVNRATIKDTAQSREILETLAKILKDNPKITKLRVEGHTDSSGSAKKNMKLSQARAEAVVKWLASHEIDANRLTAQGFGPTRPTTDNDTPEHRALNRRTEFHLQEVDGKPVADEGAVAETKTVASQ
jgi:OOP family OmpA-OmpF porin